TRTHLNKELIHFPEGVNSRTEAIQHRIENADVKRKISKDQVRAIRIMLSGTHEDMKEIEESGNLDNWCTDNIDWLKQTYGEKNLVSAILHMDEKTPHIHATVVPIVTGERRKVKDSKKQEISFGKKEYKKKSKDTSRLCADDVMARNKLKEYQNSYAEWMKPYGLDRGIDGSKAKHTETYEYYRNIFLQTETIKEEIGSLQQEKEQERQAVKLLQQKEAQEQLRLSALQEQADKKQSELKENQKLVQEAKTEVKMLGVEKSLKKTAKNISDGIGSLMGNRKAKKLEAENNELRQEIETLQEEKEAVSKQAKKDIAEKDRSILEKDSTSNILRSKLDKLFDCIPALKEYDFILRVCETIQLPYHIAKQAFSGKDAFYTGKLFSPEHGQHFEADNAKITIDKSPKDNTPFLAIEGKEYSGWFREQKQKFFEYLGIKVNQPRNGQRQRR
ncbi:plasmid recombination enzyme, partial [Dysgonomonas alginatilytica]